MITILSYNVRGISSRAKQILLLKWIENNPHDIILLQELHMTTQSQLDSFKHQFPEYNIICSLGTWAAGGVIIMIKHKLCVVDSGADHCGRIAFVKIIVNNCPITVANVYAPTKPNDRCDFFEDLHLYIPSSLWMIIGGDFNCYGEPSKDRFNHHGRADRRSYSFLNSHFLQPLSLVDLFRSKHPHSIVFSYHDDTNNIHSRIDFLFGTNLVRRNTHHIAYVPIGISDHDGISFSLTSPPSTLTEYNRWICNSEVIKRPSFLPRFRKIWEVISQSSDFDNIHWWFDLKTSLTLLLQDEQKQIVDEARRDMKNLQKSYRVLAIDSSTDDLIEMAKIRSSIRKLLLEKTTANYHGYRERNAQKLGEIAQSRLASTRSNQAVIQFLNHPVKGRVDQIEDMLDVATSFYRDLYQEKDIDTSLWTSLFDGLPKLKVEERALLDRDITVTECYEALRSMSDGKTPGDDGISVEVWRIIFPLIGNNYVQMINNVKKKGCFPPEFLRALLSLLKKTKTADGCMKNYRPLSLMNIDYKILSKVLSIRIRKVLSNIIHRDQTCSIPGRTIQDNVILIRSIIEYQQQKRDPIGLVLWDQEKAFDRVNHRYLVGVLEAFGFGSGFIDWVKLLYANGSFRIKVNNYISKSIDFKSGVRQGCSLSGCLFVISLEPLLHRIRSNQSIPGILPPGGQFAAVRKIALAKEEIKNIEEIKIKTIAYADDVNTIVRNKEEEKLTLDRFELYNSASGAKTNAAKTEIFWISDWLPPPHFEARVRCDWCNFLGVPIDSLGLLPRSELERKLNKIKQQIGYWSQINLSLGERVTVMKVFILSQFMYWFSLITIPQDVAEELQKMIVKFFWSSLGPRINFRTIIGHKRDGGFGVTHVATMVSSLRIKCGLQLLNPSYPAPWKFFALIYTAAQLRQFTPFLWSNLTPHIENGNSFFHEVASSTVKWLKAGGSPTFQQNDPSIYWQLINCHHFRKPICEIRNPHLKDINFFKLLRENLPTRTFDFWMLLANYGIHTRSRLGHNDETKQCHLCNQIETPAHLFTNCPRLINIFDTLNNKLQSVCGYNLTKSVMSVIYLKEIIQLPPVKSIRGNMVFLIGSYLHTVWTYRNIVRHQRRQNRNVDPVIAIRLFSASTKHLPFDNG